LKFLNGITATLVGYTKASAAAAIAATDTIAQAIGKLEANNAHMIKEGFAPTSDDLHACLTTGTYRFIPTTANIPYAGTYGIAHVYCSLGTTHDDGDSNSWIFIEAFILGNNAVKFTTQKQGNGGSWASWQAWNA
jgi:hypothetical protein